MKSLQASAAALCFLAAATLATPAEKSIKLPDDNPMAQLKAGEGVEVVRANCIACHSTDYIVRQPGRDMQQWEAEIKKMVTVFGAPVSDPDAKILSKYLASAYGPAAKRESDKPGAVRATGDRTRR